MCKWGREKKILGWDLDGVQIGDIRKRTGHRFPGTSNAHGCDKHPAAIRETGQERRLGDGHLATRGSDQRGQRAQRANGVARKDCRMLLGRDGWTSYAWRAAAGVFGGFMRRGRDGDLHRV